MAALNMVRLNPMRAGTLRRVVRRGAQFICGLCRSSYDGEADAHACVQLCWQDVLSLAPVIPKRRGPIGLVFRCRFCARDFATADDAQSCAADCRVRLSMSFEREVALQDAVDLPRRARFKPKPAQQMVRVPPKLPKVKAPVANEAKASAAAAVALPTPVTADVRPPVAAQASSAATDAAASAGEPKEKKRRNTSEAFYRDGARYACSECNKRFFTREDVEACYAAHP